MGEVVVMHSKQERRPNPLELVGPIVLVWFVILVAGYFIWPEAYREMGTMLVKAFWKIVPHHVHP